MIQRIQTLYLLAAAALVGATMILPLARFADGVTEDTLKAFAISNSDGEMVQSTIYMGILLSISALLPFVNIFLFRRRMLQMRLCVMEMVLLAGCAVMIGIYCWLGMHAVSSLPFSAWSLGIGIVFPLVAIVFVALAARAIFRDELLVRSLDRIR